MSNTYHFAVATQYNQEDFWKKSQIGIFLEKEGLKNHSTVFYQNKEGLTSIYNNFISDIYRNKHLIFVHDDVLIEDLFWREKLDVAFEKYDIVGLAGAKKIDLSKPPAWHLMSDRQDHVGEVAHCRDKKVWTTVFGPTESRVLVMDGLFIAVDINKLLDNNVKFDERFDFHLYDITFCLRANQNKLKMGVTPIRVVHFGLGDSLNDASWAINANKFKQLYK